MKSRCPRHEPPAAPRAAVFLLALAASAFVCSFAQGDDVAYRPSSLGLFGTELDDAFATTPPLLSFDLSGSKRYLVTGIQSPDGLSLNGDGADAPYSIGWADLTGRNAWFVQGSFLLKTATDSGAANSTTIPASALHTVVAGSDTYQWADTVNSLYYQEGAASIADASLDAGWNFGLWKLGLSASYSGSRGNFASPLQWLEENRDEWSEIYYNAAADGAAPEPTLDHIELTERRCPLTSDAFELSLPLAYGPNSMGFSFGCLSDDKSSSVTKQYFYPAGTVGTFAFDASSDVVDATTNTYSYGGRYAYTFMKGDASLRLGASGYADYTPASTVSEDSIVQSYDHMGDQTYASFRNEVETDDYTTQSLTWGSFAELRVSAPLRAQLFSLAAALDLRLGFEDLSGLVPLPTAYADITRTDSNGNGDFDDAVDTIESKTLSVSSAKDAKSYLLSSRVALPAAISVPLPFAGKGPRSDAKVEFFASFEPVLEYTVSIETSGQADEVYADTVTTGTGVIDSTKSTSSTVTVGTDVTDAEFSISAQWLAGLLFRFRGNADVFLTASGASNSSEVDLALRTVVPLP